LAAFDHQNRSAATAMQSMNFIEWYCSEPRLSFNRTVVLRYRIHLESRKLAPGTINVRLAAVRRLAYEASDAGLLSPELAGGIRRVKGVKKLGVRLGNWLSAKETRKLWQSPDADTSRESGTERLLPYCSVAVFDVGHWSTSVSIMYSAARIVGRSSISAERAVTFELFPFLTG